MYLTNVITGKRYIKKLVEDGIVDGWDDPRLVSIAALRRRSQLLEEEDSHQRRFVTSSNLPVYPKHRVL